MENEATLLRIGADPTTLRREPAWPMNWKQQAVRLRKEAHAFCFAFKHPNMPWYAKLVAGCTAAYLLSPIQFIPSFIPVVGFLDDLLVLWLGIKLLQRITPRDVLIECREKVGSAAMPYKNLLAHDPSILK